MLDILIFLLIGIAIGWNLPQPDWAKSAQEKVMSWLKD